MFSKLLSILIAVSIATVLTSCGFKIGEEPPKTQVAEFKNTQCLNQAIDDLKVFFDGQASDQNVDLAFRCISQVLIAFKDNVNGANREYFEVEELAYFIESQFLEGRHSFSPNFLKQILKIKYVLLGGSQKVISKKDILSLSELIDRLRPEIVKINSEMKIIVGDWQWQGLDNETKERRFLQSKTKAANFFKILSLEFSRTGKSYEADDLFNFIKETALFAKADPATIDKVTKAQPFLINFKKYLVGNGTAIQSQDWQKITSSLHEFLFQILRINYFLNHLAENQDVERWQVYQKVGEDVIQLFSTLLQAQERPVLTHEQLYDLIASVLPVFTEKQITPELIESLTELKIALIGVEGSSLEYWTPRDLNRIKLKLPALFKEIQEMVTLFKRLDKEKTVWKTNYSDFVKIESEFNQTIIELSDLFDGPYSIIYLKKFLIHLDKSQLLEEFKLPEDFNSYYKLALALKYTLTGIQGADLTNLQLKDLIKSAGKVYFHYLEMTDYIKPYSFEKSAFYSNTLRFVPKVESTIRQILKSKKSAQFSNLELMSVYSVLTEEKFLKIDLSVATFDQVLTVLWNHVLMNPQDRLKGQTLTGFTTQALDELVNEAKILLQTGLDSASIFAESPQIEKTVLLDQLKKKYAETYDPVQFHSLAQQIRVLEGPIVHSFDENGFLQIFSSNGMLTPKDIMKSALSSLISRMIIRSYSQDLSRAQSLFGASLPEVEHVFDDLKSVFYDLKLIDRSNTTFISSRYREANLFVAHANGDGYANFEEIHDLVMHIFSGLDRANAVKVEIVKNCLPPQNQEVDGQTTVFEDCLLNQYWTSGTGFEALPEFTQMKTQFTDVQNKTYYFSLLKAAGHIPNEKKTVKFDDLNLFPHVVQYIEMIFQRYDLDQDRVLTKDEALQAYPVFRSTIKDVLKVIPSGDKITEAQLPGVFMYLLKFGKPPKTLAEKLQFAAFISDEKKWVIQSTRLDLGAIFNFIADALAKP